ncbi:hypothetical protein FBY24_3051 [Cellulomonas sp. SLBN-39]|nr:hypothetical protein FBY24_3051 [Cellulomonas sp. SLBN-39]
MDGSCPAPPRYPAAVPRPTDRARRAAAWRAVVATCLLLGACTGPSAPDPSAATATSPVTAPAASPEPTESLITDAVGEHTAVGELVEGFPTGLVPVPDGAEVLVSSAEQLEDGRWRISLNLRTDQDVAGLVAAVRDPLVAAGFTEQADTPEDGLAARSTFARGDAGELLVVGVLDRDGVRTLTLGGTVVP